MKKYILFLVVVGLVAVYVWPTRYQQYGPGEIPYDVRVTPKQATRVDRLTGDIEALQASGEWRKVGNSRKALAFQTPDANPNAIHRPAQRNAGSAVDQQERSIQRTQKAVDSATKGGN